MFYAQSTAKGLASNMYSYHKYSIHSPPLIIEEICRKLNWISREGTGTGCEAILWPTSDSEKGNLWYPWAPTRGVLHFCKIQTKKLKHNNMMLFVFWHVMLLSFGRCSTPRCRQPCFRSGNQCLCLPVYPYLCLVSCSKVPFCFMHARLVLYCACLFGGKNLTISLLLIERNQLAEKEHRFWHYEDVTLSHASGRDLLRICIE